MLGESHAADEIGAGGAASVLKIMIIAIMTITITMMIIIIIIISTPDVSFSITRSC